VTQRSATPREAWLCSYARTPFTRATKGALATTRPDDLLAGLVERLVVATPAVRDAIDDFVVGCAYPEAEQGRNAARAIALLAGLPDRTPGMTLTRMCASGLEAVAVACGKVALGEADVVLAGGMESMTMVLSGGGKPSPNPRLAALRPDASITMGQTAERVARRFGVTRADQDAWALQSHERATAARARGFFAGETVPVDPAGGGATVVADDATRPDTSLEKLAALKPAFAEDGSVTAGNSCPMSDGAALLVVATPDRARALGLEPLGRFVSYATAGVDPAIMGIGPVEAVPRALERAGLGLAQIDRIELNEAFASQVVAVVRGLGLDATRVNPNGGAIALGHPLGATGVRLAGTLLRELARADGRYGLATLCVGGGMGAALVLERIQGGGR
jgi:acetyl-CoA acyltransferase